MALELIVVPASYPAQTAAAAALAARTHACVRVCACRERISRRGLAYAHVCDTTSNTRASASASTAHQYYNCARARWRALGRAHRPRARDRAAPSERDGAIEHVDCASGILHTAPVRRRPAARSQPRARPARAAEGRRAVALVSEIATPSNTSAPLTMITAPPLICTRADAERSGAPCSCMRSRGASRGGAAHGARERKAPMRRMRLPCAPTSTCASCDGCSTCY